MFSNLFVFPFSGLEYQDKKYFKILEFEAIVNFLSIMILILCRNICCLLSIPFLLGIRQRLVECRQTLTENKSLLCSFQNKPQVKKQTVFVWYK